MKYTKLLCICMLLFSSAYASYEDSLVVVRISFPQKTINFSDDLFIHIEIISKTNRKIIVPKSLSLGFIQDSSGFICFQLQKKIGKLYKDVKPHGFFDTFFPEDILDTINVNESRENGINISTMSVPCYGSYRIRVLCFFSAYNDMPDIYSDWLYYNCKEKVYPDTKRKNSKK